MLKKLVTSTAIILSLASTTSFANDTNKPSDFKAGDWLIRARALGVLPGESSNITPIGGKAEVDNSYVPELDFSYFFTSNIAAELILATTPHDVTVKNSTAGASVDAGNVWLLPPTLTLQYHFTNFESFKPYVGAGVNYTMFYNEDSGALNNVTYKDNFGYALQAGFDVPIQGSWYFNFDIKKVYLSTDAKFNNNSIVAKVDIDPTIVGLGIGYKF